MNTKAKRTVDWNRQAVLLIHGIGEQRPMETLRRFAETVWSKDENLHRPHKAGAQMWSKPYSLSENFELCVTGLGFVRHDLDRLHDPAYCKAKDLLLN